MGERTTGNKRRGNERRQRMMLRRLGLVAPLAVLVAVLVHLALFGVQHAPGADHADGLLSSLGAGLALAALGTVLFAALRRHRGRRHERRGAGLRGSVFALELAAGGTLAFGLIERTEGHTPLAGGAWQVAATLAVACAVALVARALARVLVRSGSALAAFASSVSRSPMRAFYSRALHSLRVSSALRPSASRGRAPPLFA